MAAMTESSQTLVSPAVAAWGGVSKLADLGGPVHYVDFGGPAEGPPIVLVHGLGGSHLNWCLLAPWLAEQARVLAVDLVGFGLTFPNGRSASVRANIELLGRFVREVAGAPAVVVGNSMGGMISILYAAAHPEQVAGLVLIDPALPWVAAARPDRLVTGVFLLYALPRVGERYLARRRARLSPPELVRQVLDLCCADPSVVPDDLVAASIELVERRATEPGLDEAFLAAARSLLVIEARRERYWAAMHTIGAPVLLMHGTNDRLVSVRAAREAAARNRNWRYQEFRNVGHVPQLEVPERVAELMLSWLATAGVRR
jgi:pimeloyl-ACP methyl ester carboxylesterase